MKLLVEVGTAAEEEEISWLSCIKIRFELFNHQVDHRRIETPGIYFCEQ